MTETTQNNGITVQNVLFPLTLVSLALFLLLAFQMSQVLKDRESLIGAKAGQEKAIEDSQRIQAQLVALIVGTQKLAGEGNAHAAEIVEKLKSMGVIPQPPTMKGFPAKAAAPGAAPGMVPAHMTPMPKGPQMMAPSVAPKGLPSAPVPPKGKQATAPAAHPPVVDMRKEPVSPAPIPVPPTPANEPVKP